MRIMKHWMLTEADPEITHNDVCLITTFFVIDENYRQVEAVQIPEKNNE